MDNQDSQIIYSKEVIEFVTVATEYCVRMEHASEANVRDFATDMLKILPLLYVKGMVLKDVFGDSADEAEDETEHLVTEEDYNFVLEGVAAVMGSHDDYLDVFVEDMKYSDTPIRKTISEDLADIYQNLRNFVGIYQQRYEEAMTASLHAVVAQFPNYWGQRITCVVRALHDVLFLQEFEAEQEDTLM